MTRNSTKNNLRAKNSHTLSQLIDIPQFLVFLVLNKASNDAVNLSNSQVIVDPIDDIGLYIQLRNKNA